MSTEQTSTIPPTVTTSQTDAPTASTPTVTPASGFVPPRLTKMGKVATLTQDGLGGSLGFP